MGYYPQIGANLAGIGEAIGGVMGRNRERDQERAFIEAARSAIRPDGTLDYNMLATRMMGLGDIRSGMAASKMGFEQAAQQQEAERRKGLSSIFGGAPAPVSDNVAPARPTGNVSQMGGQAMKILMAQGLTPVQAAGVVGNLVQESRLNPTAVGDNGTAFGVAQWRGERLNRLKRYAASLGKDYTDFETQVSFIPMELQQHETAAWQALQQAQTPRDAAAAMISYERPQGWTRDNPTAGHGWDNRLAHARAFAGQPQQEAQPVQMADASGTVAIPQQQAEPAQAFQRGQRGQQDLRTFINSLPQAVQDSLRLVAQSDPDKALEMATGMFVDQQEARKERRQDRREQRREAPTLVTLYDDENGREYKARWDPKKQTYIQVGGTKAPSGTKFSVTNPDGTTVEYMAGDNNELTSPATNSVQTKAINASELGSRIAAIAQDFTPEDFTIGERFANVWRSGKAKIDPSLLEPGEAEKLAGYASRRAGAIENINRILNELSGAAVSPAEAQRLQAAQPHPGTGIFDGDDPVTFKAKMERVLSDVQRSLARYRYYQTVGIPKNVEEIPLTDVQQVAGKWYVKRDGKVFEIGSDQEIQAQ